MSYNHWESNKHHEHPKGQGITAERGAPGEPATGAHQEFTKELLGIVPQHGSPAAERSSSV